MSNPTPIIPPVVPYPATYRPFTNAVPFTARSGATFQEELYGIKNWLNETLVPYLGEQFPAFTDSWKAMAEEIIDSFNENIVELTALIDAKVTEIISGTTVTDTMMKNVALIPGGLFATQLDSTIKAQSAKVAEQSFKRGLAPWFARTSKRAFDTRPMTIWVMSHSIGEGSGSSTRARRWVSRLADALPSLLPAPGVTVASRYYPTHHASVAVTSAWTFNKTSDSSAITPTFIDNVYGFGGRSAQVLGAQRMILDNTLLPGATTARIFYPTGPNLATIAAYVDGVQAKLQVPSTTVGEAFVDVTLTGSNTSFEIRHVNVSLPMHINGVIMYYGNETKGVSVIDASHAGWSSQDYVTNQVTNRNTITWLAGLYSQFLPQLCIIDLLANDYAQGVNPTQTEANIRAMIAAVRAAPALTAGSTGGYNVSFLLVADVKPGSPTSPAYSWDKYVAVHDKIAATDTGAPGAATSAVSSLDLNDHFPLMGTNAAPGPAITLGLFSSDAVHPSDPGHQMIADIETKVLTTP